MTDISKIRTEIGNFIPQIKSAKDVYGLFGVLNYPEKVLLDISFKRKVEQFDFRKEDRERINEIYTILSFGEDLPVFLIEARSISSQFIRSITKTLSDRYIRFLLVLTDNYNSIIMIFPDLERIEAGKHKLKITKLTLLKDEICYSDLDTLANIYYDGKEESWRDVWKKWKDAFSVERVTDKFFDDYASTFFKLRTKLDKQGLSRKEAHEFALQFLNRIMFIYFVSKKRWLNDDPKFMKWLWFKYLPEKNKGNIDKDSFYKTWLRTIFFEAFNNQKITAKELPADVTYALSNAPFLNGGLFTENDLDKLPVTIDDNQFIKIFHFFENYRFTIREDMPLEYEVAVNPQMLGYVYESLANVAEEIYDRNDMGIFYTPAVEVDFMCRRSLIEYLAKHMPEVPKEKIYQFIFDEDKTKPEDYFEKEKLWNRLEEVLDDLSVVDPACGSGAFLVGMLNVLTELYKTIYKHLKRSTNDFGLKSRIIGHSLYGVDVMGWAVHCAELRLWLQLIVETELKKDDLKKHALLPNLNLNLRIGDSLVQEIGETNLHLRDPNIPKALKKKLGNLKIEKEKYFNNDLTAKFTNKDELLEEESRIFSDVLDIEILKGKQREMQLNKRLKKLKITKQTDLSGKVSKSEQKKLVDEADEIRKNLEKTNKRITEFKAINKNLHDPEMKPFVWDIDFAEIFGDKGGFDIVIGNPPYVRQEKISPPNKLKEEVSKDDKKIYKAKLRKSVAYNYPFFPKCKKSLAQFKDVNQANIDSQSDYYIYFYFNGISILNPKGTFCFITSNSWLDVDYGKELQEFLLKYVPVYAIYDNLTKRSFAHADVNTIIVLFGALESLGKMTLLEKKDYKESRNKNRALNNIAKFVMYKRPFEEVLNSKNLIEIENVNIKKRGSEIHDLVKNIIQTSDYKVFPIVQVDLLEDGWEYPDGYNKKEGRLKKGEYKSNKWGAKYLRAPDIYYTLIEKGKDKLIKLGKLTSKTQRNTLEKFTKITVLNENYSLDKNYPYLSSIKDVDTIKVDINKLGKSIKKSTKKPIDYLIPDIISNRFWGERHFFIEGGKFVVGDTFFVAILEKQKRKETILALLNSTFSIFITEIIGRKNLGGGLLTIYGPELIEILLLDPNQIEDNKLDNINNIYAKLSKRKINSIYEECGLNIDKPFSEQEPNPISDRKDLDDIIFNIIGLTENEKHTVYKELCQSVKQRHEKAKSLRK